MSDHFTALWKSWSTSTLSGQLAREAAEYIYSARAESVNNILCIKVQVKLFLYRWCRHVGMGVAFIPNHSVRWRLVAGELYVPATVLQGRNRARLDILEMRKISCCCGIQILEHPIHILVTLLPKLAWLPTVCVCVFVCNVNKRFVMECEKWNIADNDSELSSFST
jgi:hypothetical protein